MNPTEWLANLLPNVPLLAKPKAKPVAFRSKEIRVPVGHRFPLGNLATQPFAVTVEYGARWHPEWDAPRICVVAFRFMPHGDAIGFTGERALAFPLPKGVVTLALAHGQTIDASQHFLLAMLEELGLTVPEKPEPLAAFIARPAQMMATKH